MRVAHEDDVIGSREVMVRVVVNVWFMLYFPYI